MTRRDAKTDRLFERFCATGDPDSLGAVFDRTAPELLRIAAFLTGDRDRAEEAVQRTFLVALESRDRFEVGRPVTPWLCGVLANQVRNLQRSARRARPVLPEPLAADAATLAGQREFAAEVARIRAGIPDPYRQVLELHFDHGLAPKDIAGVLRRPAATVRTQLARGLDLLRRSLSRGFVAGLALSAVSPAGLPRLRTELLAEAARAAPPTVTGVAAASAAAASGGLLIMQKHALVLTVAGIALVAAAAPFLLRSTPPPETAADAVAETKQAPIVTAPPADAPSSAVAERSAVPAPSARSAPRQGGSVDVTVRSRAGEPLANIGLELLRMDDDHPELRALRAVTGADGRFAFEGLQAGSLGLQTSLDHSEWIELADGERRVVELVAGEIGRIRGLVVAADGTPVDGADVWVSETDATEGQVLTQSGPGGRYEVTVGAGRHELGARVAGHRASHLYLVKVPADRVVEQRLALRPGGASLRGVVRAPGGAPIDGAAVSVGRAYAYPVTRPGDPEHLYEPAGPVVTTKDDGGFTLHGLEPGEAEIAVDAAGFAPHAGRVVIAPGDDTRVDVTLEPGATVEGRVIDASGSPAAGANVSSGTPHRLGMRRTVADADGRYVLGGLPAGEVAMTATCDGVGRARERVPLVAAATTAWNPILSASPTICGTVLGVDGQPLAGVRVGVGTAQIPFPSRQIGTASDGTFEIDDLERMPYRLFVLDGGMEVLAERADVRPDGAPLVLQVTPDRLPSARIRGRVVGDAGVPLEDVTIGLVRVGQSWGGVVDRAEDGGFDSGLRRAGTYDLSISAPGRGCRSLVVELAPDETRDLGDLQLGAPASLEIDVIGADGAAMPRGLVQLVPVDGGRMVFVSAEVEGGTVQVGHLAAGRWLVQVAGGGAVGWRSVELAAGEAARLTVTAAASCPVRLSLPPMPPDQPATLELHAADGELAWCAPLRPHGGSRQEPTQRALRLPPGRYTAVLDAGRQGRAEQDFVVEAGSAGVEVALGERR